MGRQKLTSGLSSEFVRRINTLKAEKQVYYHNYTAQHSKCKVTLEQDEFRLFFDILNLTQGERDAVYEAVIELVENRLNKADSLSVSREQRKRIAAVEETLGIWIGLPERQEPVEENEENEDEVESFYA
jgi:hypothetical protein